MSGDVLDLSGDPYRDDYKEDIDIVLREMKEFSKRYGRVKSLLKNPPEEGPVMAAMERLRLILERIRQTLANNNTISAEDINALREWKSSSDPAILQGFSVPIHKAMLDYVESLRGAGKTDREIGQLFTQHNADSGCDILSVDGHCNPLVNPMAFANATTNGILSGIEGKYAEFWKQHCSKPLGASY